MDAKFYEFWEDFIKKAGSGSVAADVFTDWMTRGLASPGELTDRFKAIYGLDQVTADAPEYEEMAAAAREAFDQSLSNFYAALAVVPKKEYDALEKKCKKLQQQVADLEAVVTQLKLLFKTNSSNVEEGIRPLNKMLKTQNEHFLKMMDSLAEFYGISKEGDKNREKD